MKIFITGGTGFIGSLLSKQLLADNHKLFILSRSDKKSPVFSDQLTLVHGDPTQSGDWQAVAKGCNGFINLAGAPIFRRWSSAYKKTIMGSRISSTRNLVRVINSRPANAPATFISTSAVGYYGFRDDTKLDESALAGDDFLARVCHDWEAEAMAAQSSECRVAITRFGIVLGQGGGALSQLLPLFKTGLGGRLGHGRQWFSWIHAHDLIKALVFCFSNESLSGSVNLTSPNPVTNQDLTKALGHSLHRPTLLPVPASMLKLIKGEFGSILLKGQRVVPKVLIDAGFEFRFPDIDKALADLVK